MSKTIIVSNRLPVRIERTEEGLHYKPSEGGLATGLGSIYKEGDNIWIGWPGLPFEDLEEQQEVNKSLTEHNMRGVFLTNEEVEKYYLGFSNQVLWPAFHYFMHYIQYDSDGWDAYYSANRKFADAIAEWLEPDDVIWVHDYQLLLVPQMVREQFPQVTIGFFQHIPFPSYEVFRTIPWRQELLEGVLGADYISFHTYDDMRHFLSSCHRLTGHPYTRNRITTADRTVVVESLPMGIDYDKYYESALSEDALQREARYRSELGDQKLILSMDRLDYSKGIAQRLIAFDEFLEKNPQYRKKVSLLLIVVPSRDTVPSYQSLKERVDELVGRINGKYGAISWTPVHYFYRSYPLGALSAFYRMCDIAMITPMRDGMNLVCKEFIASKADKKGVLILSEMAGAAKELSDALLINPNDRPGMVRALEEALEMPEQEQIRRMDIMQRSLKKFTIFHWVNLFIQNLKEVKEGQSAMTTERMNPGIQNEIVSHYQSAEKRLLLLDYDGTLVPFHNNPLDSRPDTELIHLITELSSNPQNQVTIISGRNNDTLQEWLGQYPVDMIAEHGVWFKEYGKEWQIQIDPNNDDWREETLEIMTFYADRTPGALIEEKKYALVWHYRRAEKGLGDLRSSELSSHLRHYLSGKGIDVMEGNQIVEVKPSAINKGIAATQYMAGKEYDFIFAVGDDRTDEDTFRALRDKAYTIKVGGGSSHARYGVSSYRIVRHLLGKFVG